MNAENIFEKTYVGQEDPLGTSYLVLGGCRLESTFDFIRERRYKNSLDVGCGEGVFITDTCRKAIL